jgi:hypothetical protein
MYGLSLWITRNASTISSNPKGIAAEVSYGKLGAQKGGPAGDWRSQLNREVWMTQGFLPFPPRLFGGTHTA